MFLKVSETISTSVQWSAATVSYPNERAIGIRIRNGSAAALPRGCPLVRRGLAADRNADGADV